MGRHIANFFNQFPSLPALQPSGKFFLRALRAFDSLRQGHLSGRVFARSVVALNVLDKKIRRLVTVA